MRPTDYSKPARPKARRKTSQTARGPQGLPTQSGSPQRRVKPPVVRKPLIQHVAATVTHSPAVKRAVRKQAAHSTLGRKTVTGTVNAGVVNVHGSANVARAKLYKRLEHGILHTLDPHKAYAVGTGGGPSPIVLGGGKVRFATVTPRTVHAPGVGKLSKNFLRDAFDLPGNTITSTYAVGKAAATGHPGKAVKMLADPVVQTVEHPVRSFKEHPLNTYLIGRGIKGTVGTGAGKVLRTIPSKTTRRIASVQREPLRLDGTKVVVNRRYSRDLTVKAGQVIADKATRRYRVKRGKPTEPQMGGRHIRQRINEDTDAARNVTAHNQEQAARQAKDAIRPKRGRVRREKANAAVTLAAQGITDGTRGDLAKYLGELEDQATHLKGKPLRANHQAREHIEEALKSHDDAKVQRAAHDVAQVLNRREPEVVATGLLSKDAAEQSRLAGPAVRRHGAGSAVTREARAEAKDVRGQAARVKRTARKDLRASEAELNAARANARVSVATRKQSPTLRAATAERDRAVKRLGQLRVQQARAHAQAKAARTTGGLVRRAVKVDHLSDDIRDTRAAVRDANERVAAERARLSGVAPREADQLRQALYNRDEARTNARAASVAHETARRRHVDLKNASYVTADHRPLTNTELRSGLKFEPAYVSHQPLPARTAALPVDEPHLPVAEARSGDAIRHGTLDVHPDRLIEQAAGTQRLVDASRARSKLIEEYGRRDGNGDLELRGTQKAAEDRANELLDQTGRQWSPIHHGDQYAVVPHEAVKQLQAHAKRETEAGHPLVRGIGRNWRVSVLGFNPRWLFGNVAEAALRSMISRTGVRSYYTGRKALSMLDPETRADVQARAAGGGNYSHAGHLDDQTRNFKGTAEDLTGFASAVRNLRERPTVQALSKAYGGYTKFVFRSLNGTLEHQFQTAMFGRALRDHPLMENHTIKLSEKAVREAAEGLKGTAAQVELGRMVDDMYGRYGKYSPTMQHGIANYTPFIAWTLNATNFLYHVLPRDHPVLTGLLASANVATESWRKHHGLYFDIFGQTGGQVPAWLQGSIPGKGDSHLRLSRYTPFGLLSQEGAGPLGSLQGLILPQLSEVTANFAGKDYEGMKLNSGGDNGARDALAGAVSFLEGQVPAAAQVAKLSGKRLPNQRDLSKQRRAEEDSKSLSERAQETFLPLEYTAGSKPTKRKKSGGYGSSSSGWSAASGSSSGGYTSNGWGSGSGSGW